MSAGDDVTRSGPRGYEFQYEVTAWLALQAPTGSALYVETHDGEDAELRLEGRTGIGRVDLQVKGTTDSVGLDAIVDLLTHFPKHGSDACLLERLGREPTYLVVLVAAGRALDDTLALCADATILEPHPASGAKSLQRLGQALHTKIAALPAPNHEKTQLQRDRWSSLQAFVAAHPAPRIGTLLQRVQLVESTSRSRVRDALVDRLITNGLARSVARDSLSALGDLVRMARDTRDDLLPHLRRFVAVRLPSRAGPIDPGIEAPQHEQLRQLLEHQHVVLLTGDSQSGKSHAAGLLCQELQQLGWDYVATDTVDDAARALGRNDAEDTVLLLEDPFGHQTLRDDAQTAWSRLARLLPRARSNRRILVTSASARVGELANTRPWMLGTHPWIDMTSADVDFLRQVWNHLARALPAAHRSAVEAHLDVELWQPGHLQRLADHLSTWPVDRALDFDALDRHARREAAAIARSLLDSGAAVIRVVEALGLTATTLDEVTLEELTFVLEGGAARPGLAPTGDSPGLELGGPEHDVTWPSYPSSTLTPEHVEALSFLERRGFIVARQSAYVFTHPDYVLAARLLLERPTMARATDLRGRVERSLSCLRPATARVAARTFRLLASHPECLEEILEAGRVALRSLFPAVRDRMAETLLRHPHYRDDEELVMHALTHESWDLALHWRAGEAWYSPESSSIASLIEGLVPSTTTLERAQIALERLAHGERIGPEAVRDVLFAAHARRVPISNAVAEQFLSYDEALLRASTAEILLRSDTGASLELIQALLHDPSPRVWATTLDGLLAHWHAQPQPIQASVLESLQIPLGTVRVHVAARRLLRLPDAVLDEHGELPVTSWPFWAELMTRVLVELPAARFELDRLSFLLEDAVVDVGTKVALVDGWARALEAQHFARVIQSDGLRVAATLLAVTHSAPHTRGVRLATWLATHDTAFVAVTIGDMVESWTDLLAEERAALLGTLRSGRSDVEWLRAVALTRATCPSELATELGIVNDNPRRLLETTPASWLASCLDVALGANEVWSVLDLTRRFASFWNDVAFEVLLAPTHAARAPAIRWLLARRKQDDLWVWQWICVHADRAECRSLFDALLEASVTDADEDLHPFWSAWRVAPAAEPTSVLAELVAAAPSIDRFDTLRTIVGDDLWMGILTKLDTDAQLTLAFFSWRKGQTTERELLDQALVSYRRSPPRLPSTHASIRTAARRSSEPDVTALLDQVERLRDDVASYFPRTQLPHGWCSLDEGA